MGALASVDNTCEFVNAEGYTKAMNYKKIANANYDEIGSSTSRSVSPHGLGPTLRREKRRCNRAAKRKEARFHFEDQCNTCDLE